MVPTGMGRRSLAICAVVLGLTVWAAPAHAQTTGALKGRVVDAQNKPVDGAKITILMTGDRNLKLETKSRKGGDYMQIGISTGDYTVTAEKDGLAQSFRVHISLGDAKEVNFVLKPGGAAVTKEEAEKAAARVEGIKAKFAEGATLSNEGKYDEAIARFTEVMTDVPNCVECYLNIGSVYAQKKEYDKSEEFYKKALEANPESVDAYNGLATIYNAQKKFKEAQEMSAEASKRAAAAPGGGGNADALYNQGVIAWNANDFQAALEHFNNAVKAKPEHAEAHFMLGKVYLNLGKLAEAAAEFQTYTKVAPNGPNAKEAQSNFEALKSYIK
jgi:tetratricopeptide (TPR) repeat protein